MNIPGRVKIGAYEYEVIMKERLFHDSDECNGLCDSEEFKIYLSEERNKHPQNLEETFIHECLHGIEKSINLDLGEETVTRLATALYGFLLDNGYVKVGKVPARTKKRKKRS